MTAEATPSFVATKRDHFSAICRIVAIIPLLLIGACSSTTSTSDTDQRSTASSSRPAPGKGSTETANEPATDKYTQTWTKSYSTTTCEDWQDAMTQAQTWAAAADILTSGRNKIDGGTGLPSDSLITSFRDDISEGCAADVPGLIITDVAYGVYTIGHDQYGP